MPTIVIITVIAVMVIIFGIFLIIAPRLLYSLADRMNRIIFNLDIKILKNRLFWGTILILAGVYMVWQII